MGTKPQNSATKPLNGAAVLFQARQADQDPELDQRYRDHFHQCPLDTEDCFSCLVHTNTHYFNHNYKNTERGLHTPMTRSRAIYGIQNDIFDSKPKNTVLPGAAFRPATSACPYEDARVTFIFISGAATSGYLTGPGGINHTGRYCKTVAEKREALLNFRPNTDTLLVAWPGEYSQDIFSITTNDQRTKALARFGIVPRPTQPAKTFVAADGTEYIEKPK